jgi:DNA polymerase III delta prime subunit
MSSAVNISLSFEGREKELYLLKGLFDHRKHVLISGPPGIGKTALLNQVKARSPFLLCEDTSKLSRICDSLERQLGWNHFKLDVIERKNRLISYLEKRGQPLAFDHVAQTTPRIARFIAHLSERVPVWIACRSEMPHDIGQVWQYLPSFVRFPISPLKKNETRILIAQAVSKGVIRSDAISHLTALYRLSKGNPRVLEELLVELAARDYRMDTSFGQSLLALDQRIQEFETRLAADSDGA